MNPEKGSLCYSYACGVFADPIADISSQSWLLGQCPYNLFPCQANGIPGLQEINTMHVDGLAQNRSISSAVDVLQPIVQEYKAYSGYLDMTLTHMHICRHIVGVAVS